MSKIVHIDSIDIRPLTTLLTEVTSIFTSQVFLSGFSQGVLPEKPGLTQQIKCKLCGAELLIQCIQANPSEGESSEYTELEERLLDRRSAFGIMHQSTPYHFKQSIDTCRETITNITDTSPQLKTACNLLAKRLRSIEEMEGIFFQIQAMIASHVDTIVKARTLTLSKRDGLTELLLEVYSKGLLPFGWTFGEQLLLVWNPSES